MRILFMGTPDFAVASLRRLVADGHEIEHLDGHLFVEHIDHFLSDEELRAYMEQEEREAREAAEAREKGE